MAHERFTATKHAGGLTGPVQEWIAMKRHLASGGYPGFVRGQSVGAELPVFVYHRVAPRTFEAHLQHLSANAYRTLDCTQVLSTVADGKGFSGKDVLLTFDDGLSDLVSVVFPLLAKYRMQAVVFVAPFWIGGSGCITWREALDLHRSGRVDFQSHGFSHCRMPISPEVEDFFHPGLCHLRPWQLPVAAEAFGGNSEAFWGLPIYRSASRFAERMRYSGPEGLDRECLAYVARHGGKRFLRSPGWKARLRGRVRGYFSCHPDRGRYETEPERDRSIRDELVRSKRELENRLPGKTVFAFAFPFNESGPTVERLLVDTEFRLAFGGIGQPCEPLSGLTFFSRTNGDFVHRLPGRGRKSLTRLLVEKTIRRLRSGSGY